MWTAIALRITPGIPQHMHPVIALLTAGVEMDVLGIAYSEFSDAEREAVVQAHPRSGRFKEDIIQAFYDGIKHKPHTTFGKVKADVLANNDPHFRPGNFNSVSSRGKRHHGGNLVSPGALPDSKAEESKGEFQAKLLSANLLARELTEPPGVACLRLGSTQVAELGDPHDVSTAFVPPLSSGPHQSHDPGQVVSTSAGKQTRNIPSALALPVSRRSQ